MIFAATPLWAESVAPVVPSGLSYAAQEVLFEPSGAYDAARKVVRLRFVAPELADPEAFGFAAIEADFQALCDAVGVATVAKFAPNARQIIISVAAEPVQFGDSAPSVVKYFDLFQVENGTCIWEGL